jgi:hypothetical protein
MGEIGVDHKDNASGFETQFTDESWPLPFNPVQIVQDCAEFQQWSSSLKNVFS